MQFKFRIAHLLTSLRHSYLLSLFSWGFVLVLIVCLHCTLLIYPLCYISSLLLASVIKPRSIHIYCSFVITYFFKVDYVGCNVTFFICRSHPTNVDPKSTSRPTRFTIAIVSCRFLHWRGRAKIENPETPSGWRILTDEKTTPSLSNLFLKFAIFLLVYGRMTRRRNRTILWDSSEK